MTVAESQRLRADAGLPTEDDAGRPVYSLDNGFRVLWPTVDSPVSRKPMDDACREHVRRVLAAREAKLTGLDAATIADGEPIAGDLEC